MRIRIRLTVVSALLVTFSAIASLAQSSATDKQTTTNDSSQEAIVVDRYITRATWELDGTGARETTAVIRVQAAAGVQQLAVLAFSYTSANETVDVGYVRVRKPDGTVVVTPAYNIQDMPSDVTRIAPLYSDIREKHVAVKALNMGDVLEYSVRYRIVKAEVPGQFWFAYSFQKNLIVKDEELEVSVPRNKYVKVASPESDPKVKDDGDRRVYSWHVDNLKRQDASSTRGSKPEPPPSVQLTTFHTWDEVGSWYRGVQSAQVVVSPAIRSKADELTKGLVSDDQKIRSLYNFVATRFHYVSLSFGTGRYEPHRADEVLDNEYGDCKDKHTLLAALLKASGYDAWPALISSSRNVTPDVPSPAQFDHLITVVARGNSLLWLDTTPEIAPFGLLTANLRDKQALVMPTDKTPVLMTTPAEPPFPSVQSFVIKGKLGTDGTFQGHVERSARGDVEVLFRFGFRATSPAQWKDLVQRLSYASGFAGEVSAVTASAPEDTEQPFQFSYDYTRKDFGDWPNRRMTPPLPPFGIEAADGESSKPSEPLLLGAPGDVVYRARIELPAGYTFTPPTRVDLVTDYAEYHAEYGTEKGVLTAVRRLVIKQAKVPLSQWDGYLKFRKAVSDDEGFWISLTAVDANGKPIVAGLKSDEADTLNNSGRTALTASKYSMAAELFEKAVKADPKNKWAWNNLGLAYMGLMRYDDAVSAFNKQIQINQNDPYAYNNLGRALRIQGKQEEARKAFEKQIEINPQDRWAHSNLGILLVSQKKYAEAVHELEAAAAISENDAPTQLALGQAYLGIGQNEKGVTALEKAVQIAPSPERLNAVAYILAENGERLDQARQFAEAAVSSLDGLLRDVHLKDLQLQQLYLVNLLGASWDTLGWIYFKQGNLEQAEKYLYAAWNLDQHAAIADHLGQLFEKKGDKKMAAKFYAQAIAALSPPAETRSRLVSMVGGEREADAFVVKERDEISRQRTTMVHLTTRPTSKTSAEFFLSFVPGGSVDEIKFISGDKQLSGAFPALTAAKYNVVFPDSEATKIVRRGILTCADRSSTCDFVLLLPSSVRSLN